MFFSILIPTYKNLEYLELTINSLKKNSTYDHEVIVHNNSNDHKTEIFLKTNSILFTSSQENIGLCSAVNAAYKKSTKDLIVYAHDDMYFLPKWDFYILDEIKKRKDNFYYFSSTQIGKNAASKNEKINHIFYDAGDNIYNFNEQKLLREFETLKFYDLQGSHWAPHVVHRKIWDRAGGYSEDFNPGYASDPDFNMKLWDLGVRTFRGINLSRVYHFGSLTTRKRKIVKKNNGKKKFLKKWGISVNLFIKHYLQRGNVYTEDLKIKKNFMYYIRLLNSKIFKLFL
jgi:glycosyltransferase involved in cell wall biosynthesis